ncbi:glutathione S-transferase C-terminal domain-containing protein-like [Gigantopelta aegis]|uniref:glutathione S-transferase C-terminal domain-containing protein-like n=1 Tax=Gigantopelta aegis TaxID=1735272 RepID=UPI001B88A364|nr:glutathione S-transferase C-terminal domain-containing protein-like [Gigantopelta aegis]XP_041358720.1 glutathione S-transferase C-terminal domain-containing protein-like [Gigantopelta aegis]
MVDWWFKQHLHENTTMTEVYIEGRLSKDDTICLSLTSSSILFVIQYCQSVPIKLVIVDKGTHNNDYVTVQSLDSLCNLNYLFADEASLPGLIKNCSLPVAYDSHAAMIRSGLCCTVRHIIKLAHTAIPDNSFQDLLGFRQGSLRMCAEVSGWTKLCEVELSSSVAQLIGEIRKADINESVNIPQDLARLEAHMKTSPLVHNDNKLKRKIVQFLKKDVQDPKEREHVLQCCRRENNCLVLETDETFPHGIRRYVCKKVEICEVDVTDVGSSKMKSVDGVTGTGNHVCEGNKGSNSFDFVSAIMRLSFMDVEIVHLYSEGIEMTIADLILFVYFYHLMESVNFELHVLKDYIPRIVQWFCHMCSINQIQKTGESCGFNMDGLIQGLNQTSPSDQHFHLVLPDTSNTEHEDVELCRRNKSNFKAYKPDVVQVLNKIKESTIHVRTGQHTRGQNVQLAWDQLPSGVHPKEGSVPEKRVERKCLQLENLITAVMDIAREGNIIVDFCSGGGHLGIAIAYLLPSCKVYMIENKEESLMKARQRMDQLRLTNVVLFQCNLEYFDGHFDIGVSLHACGVATDMVLQHCLDHNAAFVICPCCYGSMQKTHLISYPRSELFTEAGITYKEFLTLGHAADQTEFKMKLEDQGRYCSNLVDTDRAELAREKGYHVTLCSLYPLSCTPKNNLLIGTLKI